MNILINNIPYPIDEGFTLNENYNETLDSAVVRISHLPSEIDIEPFDDVKIVELNRNMCIDSFTCTQEAIGQSDTTYSYTINLFSLTKKLENIILPNLSNTPRKKSSKISIYEYLKRINDLYGPKIWNNGYINKWGFCDNFINKFDSIDCPEMQWSAPTFRELFNDLTMVGDCIVVLRKRKETDSQTATELFDFIDITKATSVSKPYNYVQKSRSSDDYVSEIRMELQNVMQTNITGINNTITTSEFIPITSDDALITSDNYYLKTQFPILNIKHLWLICFCCSEVSENQYGVYTEDKTTYFKEDLCNIRAEYNGENNYSSLVYETKDYDAKEALYRDNIMVLSNIGVNDGHNIEDYYSHYKNFCLHYTRNSNRIDGFIQLSKPLFEAEKSTLEYLKRICAYNAAAKGELDPNYGYSIANNINDTDDSYLSTFFQIEYETTYNAVFSASKEERPRNNRVIADNQTNAWVDAYSQGFLEYQKANRLGNLQKMYNQRITDINDAYEIGDQISDDIVYRTEYQFYANHTECNAYATKNYVLRDYFTGIKSKIRTWVNAREEAFIRHDLKKYYCEFSYQMKDNPVESINEYPNTYLHLVSYLLSPLQETQDSYKPIKYVLTKTRKSYYVDVLVLTDYWPSSISKYALNCITRLIGNSIVLTAGFDDNWIVNKHINVGDRSTGTYYDDNGIIMNTDINAIHMQGNQPTKIYPPYFNPVGGNNIGGITTNYHRYCDDDGEFDNIEMYFLDELTISNKLSLDTNNDVRDVFIDAFNLPKVYDSISNPYIFGISMPIYKDNKEKPIISTQFEFIKDDSSIKFTNLFLQRETMIRNQVNNNALKVKLYDADNNYLDEISFAGAISVTREDDYTGIIYYTGTTENVKYISICDGNKVILSYDITKNNDKALYLNIRRYL